MKRTIIILAALLCIASALPAQPAIADTTKIHVFDGKNSWVTTGALLKTYFGAPLSGSATLDFGDVDEGGSVTSLTITITGAAVGDVVLVQYPSTSNIGYVHFSGYVSSTNTVSVVCKNDNPNSVNVPSGTYKVLVFK